MIRPGKCLLNDLHTGRHGEARVKREKKEYRHSFSPYTFCSGSSDMQRRLSVSRGHKLPRRNQGIRWLKEEDWESWHQVLQISQCGKKKKNWAVSLDWKRLKTGNRIHQPEIPWSLPPGSSVGSQEFLAGSLGQLPPSSTHSCQGIPRQMPETFSLPTHCRQMLPSE